MFTLENMKARLLPATAIQAGVAKEQLQTGLFCLSEDLHYSKPENIQACISARKIQVSM